MSRIAKQVITLPSGTQVSLTADHLEVAGPKGTLQVPAFSGIMVSSQENTVKVSRSDETEHAKEGLLRTLLQNAVTGVSNGWTKELELHGVGMRAAVTGSNLTLSLGFSHPVVFEAPQGITFQVTKNVITISGIDKQLVGEVAAKIRQLRKPEPYKGKGIRYAGEQIRRKAGKTGKAAK